ncbi:hypothetical protein SAMN04487897_10444 [Paenibacillus sp. yr247]|uniref:hypothetical protein n=1 Tax=Paenibacillus sp. yr247 TaxID=1761880 RepID=UPI00088CAD4E|nr:hypothetical protein [Paenibacillus sp. yr247]SDN67590.1 hypothetical protein SAMN04487897_10444 [Paenibacillus sp. yr247]
MNKQNLKEALNEALQDKENIILSNSILGTANAEEIVSEINNFCENNLGSATSSCLYLGFSVGASFGLALENGNNIFLKVHKPTSTKTITAISKESLTAMSRVQKSLAESGFPCPAVILDPMELGVGIATVDVFATPGEINDAHNPEIRRAIAKTLVELIRRTEPHKRMHDLTNGQFCSSKTLYPIPHNALFNFDKKSKDAEWIDAIAANAKKTVIHINGHIVLGHVDWSLKHFRFENNEVVMIYDWDSLKLEDELNILGIAAATFTTTWDIPIKITPSQEESYHFVKEYELFRGKTFSMEEMTKISAAATYCLAYVARCEYALDPKNKNYEGSFRHALHSMVGDNYLNL